MSTSNPPASQETKSSNSAGREEATSVADAFVVGAFLVCFVLILLYSFASFVLRHWS
jgi:hypothetical protein